MNSNNNLKKETNLETIQQLVDDWIQDNGGYWEPLAQLASVTEEVGELAREINHLEKIKIKKNSEPKRKISDELGDVVFSIICIANYYKISLAEATISSIEKYSMRDSERYSKKNGGT
jgi:NTP pyrophosphatase (non-canonical NTP hydrolase)